MDDVSNNFVFDAVVTVYEHVAESDDLAHVPSAVGRLWIRPAEPQKSLANNLEVSFDGLADGPVSHVGFKFHVGGRDPK